MPSLSKMHRFPPISKQRLSFSTQECGTSSSYVFSYTWFVKFGFCKFQFQLSGQLNSKSSRVRPFDIYFPRSLPAVPMFFIYTFLESGGREFEFSTLYYHHLSILIPDRPLESMLSLFDIYGRTFSSSVISTFVKGEYS